MKKVSLLRLRRASECVELALAWSPDRVTTALLRDAKVNFLAGNAADGVENCKRALLTLPDFDSRTGISFASARERIILAIDTAQGG